MSNRKIYGYASVGLRVVVAISLALSVTAAIAQDSPAANDAAAATPATPEQMPPQAPQITFQNGSLTIVAENSRLEDVLNGIHEKTGADIDVPEGMGDDRVVVRLGPGPARDVLSSLFYGMPVNYVIAGAEDNPLEVRSIVLTKRSVTSGSGTAVARGSSYNPAAERAAEAQRAAIEEALRAQGEAANAAANNGAQGQASNTAEQAAPAVPQPAQQPGTLPAPPQVNAAVAAGGAVPANDGGTQTADAGAAAGGTDASGKPQRPIDQMSNMMFKMFQERQAMIQQQKQPPKPATTEP